MKKTAAWIFCALMAIAAAASCEAGFAGKKEAVPAKQEARPPQFQQRGLHGPRRDMGGEEKERFLQKARENGGKREMRPEGAPPRGPHRERGADFKGRGAAYLERLRIEFPGLSDEELKEIAKERFKARKEARPDRPERGSRESRHRNG